MRPPLSTHRLMEVRRRFGWLHAPDRWNRTETCSRTARYGCRCPCPRCFQRKEIGQENRAPLGTDADARCRRSERLHDAMQSVGLVASFIATAGPLSECVDWGDHRESTPAKPAANSGRRCSQTAKWPGGGVSPRLSVQIVRIAVLLVVMGLIGLVMIAVGGSESPPRNSRRKTGGGDGSSTLDVQPPIGFSQGLLGLRLSLRLRQARLQGGGPTRSGLAFRSGSPDKRTRLRVRSQTSRRGGPS